MDEKKLAAAFDRWMWKFIHEPEAFKREWQCVLEYTTDVGAGLSPCYGRSAAEFLLRMLDEVGKEA